jgi:hypothetical protein
MIVAFLLASERKEEQRSFDWVLREEVLGMKPVPFGGAPIIMFPAGDAKGCRFCEGFRPSQ